jgi:hypothetical protein
MIVIRRKFILLKHVLGLRKLLSTELGLLFVIQISFNLLVRH